MSERDEFGVETIYTYDSLGRVQTTTKKGVSGNPFPAQPDVVTTYSYDADGRRLTETVSAAALSLTSSSTYDKAGRLLTRTDQAGLVTSYGYSNGGRTQTVTYPGGATQVTDRYLDGRIKSETGTAIVARYFDYGVETGANPYSQEFIGSSGPSSPRWTKTSSDLMGRTAKVERPSSTGANLILTSAYNSRGQLYQESVFSGMNRLQAVKLYEYDSLGNQIRLGLDMDDSGTLTALSTDRFVETDILFQQTGGDWFKVTTTRAYLTDNSATATILRTQQERLTNFPVNGSDQAVSEITETDVAANNTLRTELVDRSAKKVTEKTDTPDSTIDAVSVSVNGLLQSSTPTTPQSATTYSYDALARLTSVSDPRTGASTRAYQTTTGQLISVTEGAQTTTYEYFPASDPSAGRVRSQTNTQGKKVYFNYSGRGELTHTWGETSYPTKQVYDTYGQRTELHTFRGGSGWQADTWPEATTGPTDVTRWNYHEASGLLASKQDAAGRQAAYTYDTLGRLRTRTWARLDGGSNPIRTTYSYDMRTGELTVVDYSDTTPDVVFAYDRGGRTNRIADASGTRTLTHNPLGAVLTEQIASGVLNGVQISVGYDSFLRRGSLLTSRGGPPLSSQSYTYDPSSRLETVSSAAQTATYSYSPTRGFLTGTSFTGGTNVARSYDPTGRLESITTTPASGGAVSYTYIHTNLNQRTRVTREDGSYWAYGYDDRGEVTSGKRYWPDDAPVAGQQFEYDFDNIGNRNSAKAGGDAAGANLRQSSYTPNALNQYSQRTVPGAVDIVGTAHSAAAVTVNNQATYRRNEYFHNELAFDNTAGPGYANVAVVGARETTVTQQGGYTYLPQTPETHTYDLDGNLASDGRLNYAWDGENRLIRMESIPAVPAEAKQKLEFAYDYMGRRIEKKVWIWRGALGSYLLQSVTRFIYDGWNLIAELDAANRLIRSYVWGADVSGTLQGAGGVGGLLMLREGTNTYQVGYDGNANVTTLVKASTGTVAASYDYDPFGNVLKATGDQREFRELWYPHAEDASRVRE